MDAVIAMLGKRINWKQSGDAGRGRMVLVGISGILVLGIVLVAATRLHLFSGKTGASPGMTPYHWKIPDTSAIPPGEYGDLVRYGRKLIANTALYLGPGGLVAPLTNGMNCQNCHLDAGTRFHGNNYSAVFSTYPRFRARSGTVEDIYKRVNDCLQRSLNAANGLDTGSREMQAIKAYIEWLGTEVPRGVSPEGAGIKAIPFLSRAADPLKGRNVYVQYCQRCHGVNGEGLPNPDRISYVYPPLWGEHSYTTAAGMYRLSRLAGFVKKNMPFDGPANGPGLSDEECWDVAAFVNSQSRPHKFFPQDWPDVSSKPFDHPFGPYADSFPERQHKYGPFGPLRP